ncbi:MAG: hypothetical protein DWQ06_08280 [Calditrichaeota bacterium]|nr:MAG: hypothetical protein DWQ06_08280 [Calditrichota bacterium]
MNKTVLIALGGVAILIASTGFFFNRSVKQIKKQNAETETVRVEDLPLDTGISVPLLQNFKPLIEDEERNLVHARLELTPQIDSDKIGFEFLEMPENVTLVSGLREWEGVIGKDRTKKFEFSFSVKTNKAVWIHLQTSILSEGKNFTRGSGLYVDFGEKEVPSSVEKRIEGYEGGAKLSIIRKSERERATEAKDEE